MTAFSEPLQPGAIYSAAAAAIFVTGMRVTHLQTLESKTPVILVDIEGFTQVGAERTPATTSIFLEPAAAVEFAGELVRGLTTVVADLSRVLEVGDGPR